MSRLPAVVLAVVALGAGCGGSNASTAKTSSPAVLEVAGPRPSESAKMVCSDEARGDIAAAIGVDAARVTRPTWKVATHVFACDFVYAGSARMGLSVKELSSVAETTAYFDGLGRRLGRGQSFEIGDGAFQTTDGSLVVRKDYKVLLIDVSALPSQFGVPSTSRSSIAVNVSTVIMNCWTGA